MDIKKFADIKRRSEEFSYTSLKYTDFDNVAGFEVGANEENIILLYGKNKNFGLMHLHYAFNDLDFFWERGKKYSDCIITFVDERLVDRLKEFGFEIFGVWRDCFNEDISRYSTTKGIEHLKKQDYKRASDVTMACRHESRSFMGQSEEWIADWMSGENDQTLKINMSDATVLTHSVNGEIVGIVCLGIYGHESEKGSVLWVRELAVHPEYQRMGIATKLIRQAFGYGLIHGAKRAFLAVDETNTGALDLYRKMGFVLNEDESETAMYKPKLFEG